MTSRWEIDTVHSGISFAIRHMVISKVRGRFARYAGTVHLDESDLTQSVIEVLIDATSIDTGTPDRDAHLRSADFFDVETFPMLRYRSKHIERLSDDRYRVVGDLTIRGVTREVPLDVEYGGQVKDSWGNQRAGFLAKASVDRKDFGLQWNQLLETGGVILGDRVEIEIELQAIKAAAAAAPAA